MLRKPGWCTCGVVVSQLRRAGLGRGGSISIDTPVTEFPAPTGSGKGVIRADEPELLMALRLASAAELTVVVQPFLAPPGDLADLRVYCPVPRLPGAVRPWRADLVLVPGPRA